MVIIATLLIMRMYPNDVNLSPELRYKNSLQDIRKEYIE